MGTYVYKPTNIGIMYFVYNTHISGYIYAPEAIIFSMQSVIIENWILRIRSKDIKPFHGLEFDFHRKLLEFFLEFF